MVIKAIGEWRLDRQNGSDFIKNHMQTRSDHTLFGQKGYLWSQSPKNFTAYGLTLQCPCVLGVYRMRQCCHRVALVNFNVRVSC